MNTNTNVFFQIHNYVKKLSVVQEIEHDMHSRIHFPNTQIQIQIDLSNKQMLIWKQTFFLFFPSTQIRQESFSGVKSWAQHALQNMFPITQIQIQRDYSKIQIQFERRKLILLLKSHKQGEKVLVHGGIIWARHAFLNTFSKWTQKQMQRHFPKTRINVHVFLSKYTNVSAW